MDDCVFCKIINHELPTVIEVETENVIVFKTIEPAAETHLLVTPKKHIKTFLDINDSDSQIFLEMIRVSQNLIKEKNISGGYKLVFNGGKYQSVPHLHWHLLGGEIVEEWKDKI